MKINDIVYYTDKKAKFYFDVQIINIINDDEHNIKLYECKILGNNHKFLNDEFEFKNERIGEIKRYLKSHLCLTKDEAEEKIKL